MRNPVDLFHVRRPDPKLFVRAAVISMGSQSGALGEASAGPVIGAIGNLVGVRAALTVAAIILSLLLHARAIRRQGSEADLPAGRDME